MLERIEITKEFGRQELESRLRDVRLKGFPDVRIYEDAGIVISLFTPELINKSVFTPQPTIYRKGFLDRIDGLAEIFAQKGIDIFRLEGGVDYFAFEEGKATQWTIIPPVVEIITVGFGENGLDYSMQLGEELKKVMAEGGYKLNPALLELDFKEYRRLPGFRKIPLICDGSHKIHSAIEKKRNQNLLVIDAPKKGFPYYAAPKPYSAVHVEEERPEWGSTEKTHVLTEPGHKLLYRLFPTGGIFCGVVRPDKNES